VLTDGQHARRIGARDALLIVVRTAYRRIRSGRDPAEFCQRFHTPKSPTAIQNRNRGRAGFSPVPFGRDLPSRIFEVDGLEVGPTAITSVGLRPRGAAVAFHSFKEKNNHD
jgi:hypothetical protein